MSALKQNRRRSPKVKLEPIDWRELANDAVLNGNMSTLYRRPESEDASAYASDEALVEIERRATRQAESEAGITAREQSVSDEVTYTEGTTPTGGLGPSVGSGPAVGIEPTVGVGGETGKRVGSRTRSVGSPLKSEHIPTVGISGVVGLAPTVGTRPTVGLVSTVGDSRLDEGSGEDARDHSSGAVASAMAFTASAGAVGISQQVPAMGDIPTVGVDEARSLRYESSPDPVVHRAPLLADAAAGGHRVEANLVHRAAERATSVVPDASLGQAPTVGVELTVGVTPTMSAGGQPQIGTSEPSLAEFRQSPWEDRQYAHSERTGWESRQAPTVGLSPSVGSLPTVALTQKRRKVKPIRDVQDALTLAGQILYKAMYGAPDGARFKSCNKGYRQLAAETHLDKDTVRDLIVEFKGKRMVREIGTYDPDTRSSKTYEVLSYKAILQVWREVGVHFVTTGRRPQFCSASGDVIDANLTSERPTVPSGPTVVRTPTVGVDDTVGHAPSGKWAPTSEVSPFNQNTRQEPAARGPEDTLIAPLTQAMQQITSLPIDQEAAVRLLQNCRAEASDCTIEEIVEILWSKAFLCRSGKITNPIGFLITQVPKNFQGDAFRTYRENRRLEVETAAESERHHQIEQQRLDRELAEEEARYQERLSFVERFRTERGIDLRALERSPEVPAQVQEWARRVLRSGVVYIRKYQ